MDKVFADESSQDLAQKLILAPDGPFSGDEMSETETRKIKFVIEFTVEVPTGVSLDEFMEIPQVLAGHGTSGLKLPATATVGSVGAG